MKTSICLIMFLLKHCASFKKTLPVIMIDNDNVMSRVTIEPNPFEIISSQFFTELALDVLKRTACVIIFVEETLSTEDVSSKDTLGTPFFHLQKGIADRTVIYMPAVTEPYDLLRQVFEPHVSNIFHLGSGEKLTMVDKYKYAYVYFQDDAESSRVEMLRKHDVMMKEVCFTMRQIKAGPVVGFYTGKKNPMTVAQLTYPSHSDLELPKESGVMVVTPDALFRLSGVFSSGHHRRSAFADAPVVEYEMRTRRTLSTTMLVTDFHLQFNFEFEDEYWKLANVALLEAGEEVGRTETDMSAPWERSYYCSEPISIINLRDGSSITISEYQMEPRAYTRRFSRNDDGPESADVPVLRSGDASPPPALPPTTTLKPGHCYFSKHINCGPYFNSVILSGLLVATLFLVITFWGIIMLMNCGNNDRFDDVTQKPLVIAQEAGGGI